jgi:hypothetical protein
MTSATETEIIAHSSTALAAALKQLKPKQKRKKRAKDPADLSAPSELLKKKPKRKEKTS